MYTRITLDEMIDYLKAEKGWKITEPAGEEAYFDYERKGFIIRVYSSIARSGVCRAKGKDAIRVAILYVDGDDQTRGIKKFPRVTRQENWRVHLKSRVKDAFDFINTIRMCKSCGAPMAVRKVKKTESEFYGCSKYPDCTYTENV